MSGPNFVIALLLTIASWAYSLARYLMAPGTIMAIMLPLPNWFILHEHIVRQKPCCKGVKGFSWEFYPLPDALIKDMHKHIKKHSKH